MSSDSQRSGIGDGAPCLMDSLEIVSRPPVGDQEQEAPIPDSDLQRTSSPSPFGSCFVLLVDRASHGCSLGDTQLSKPKWRAVGDIVVIW